MMKFRNLGLVGLLATTVFATSAIAAPAQQSKIPMSKLYSSTATGAPDKVVYDAASAMAFLRTLSNSNFAAPSSSIKAEGGQSYGSPEDRAAAYFKTIAAGSTVMETYLAGSPAEMTVMYHMDGPNKLLRTHYCAARNVPQSRFVPVKEPGIIKFVFEGGTNLNPKLDTYAASATIRVIDKDTIEVTNYGVRNGVPTQGFTMIRSRQPNKVATAN